MQDVRLYPWSLAPGTALKVALRGALTTPRPDRMRVEVFRVEDLDTHWWLGETPPARVRRGVVTAIVTSTEGLPHGSPYEVRRLELLRGDESLGVYDGARDFPRAFFYVHQAGERPKSQNESRLLATDVEERRRVYFAEPLGGPLGPGLRQFQAVSFVERCYLTRRLNLPGLTLLPVGPGRLGEDEANIVNYILAERGLTCRLPPEVWTRDRAESRPILVFDFPRVLAATFDDAMAIVTQKRDRVVDLIALHRRATGAPVVTVLQDLDSHESKAFPEFVPYSGNVLGGFISGEDQTMYIRHSERLSNDPLLALWVSLVAEAEQETNVDFMFLRYWGILETIATARIPAGEMATDFAGNAIQVGSQNVVTWQVAGPRGAVYALLKNAMEMRNFHATVFNGPQGEDLWQMVEIWYAFRNATAHSGGFLPGSPLLTSRPWYAVALGAHNFVTDQGVAGNGLLNKYVATLREAARFILDGELNKA